MLTEGRTIVREAARYWWLYLVSGVSWLVIAWLVPGGWKIWHYILSVAFWASGSDRVYALAQRTYPILFWVGLFALFRGFSQIARAFEIRHAGKEAAAGLPAAA